MREIPIKTGVGSTAVEFTSDTSNNHDPYIIGVFAEEHCGKTRLGLTGPSGVGCVLTEMKSYVTLDKDSREFGKTIFKPKDPMSLIVNPRTVAMKPDDFERQKFYIAHVKKFEDTVYGLLEHKDVNMLLIDKFSHYCGWKEWSINGMNEKFLKVGTQLYKDKREVVQSIIDFMNSLSQYKKPVLLTCASQGDYDMVDKDKKPLRNTWDCKPFKFLGSHCNIVVELVSNKRWNPESEHEDRSWHYGLNVRRCQKNPVLEGPQGALLLKDESIGLANLIAAVDEEASLEDWVS